MAALAQRRTITMPDRWLALAAALLVLSVMLGLLWPGDRPGIALPPVLSGEEDTLADVQASRAALAATQAAFVAAQAQLAAQGTTADALAADAAAGQSGGAAATAAVGRAASAAPALARFATTTVAYQAALQHYDDALMARTRGLGPRSEQLRPATWPFVEYVKRFPPPLGLDASLHPATPAELAALAVALRADAQAAPAGQPSNAAADVATLARDAKTTLAIAGWLPEYGRLLDVYRVQVEQVAAAPDATAHGLHLLLGRAIAALLLALLAAGGLLLLLGRVPAERRELAWPALGVALLFALYLIDAQPAALAAALGFLVVAVVSPAAALVGCVAAIPFFFHPRAVGHWHFPPAELALGLTCLTVAARFVAGRRGLLRADAFRLGAADILALLFFVAGTLSLLVPARADLHVALRSYRVVLVEPLVLYVLLTRLLPGARDLRRALNAFIIVLAGVGWLAAAQFLTGSDTWSSGGVARALGVEPSATALGIELGRGVILALVLALFHPERRARLGYGLLALPGLGGLLVSFTRGAWIATALGLGAAVLARRAWRWLLALAAAGAVAAAVLATSHVERLRGLFSLQSSSNSARLQIWGGSLQMARDHALRGIGLDQFLAQDPTRYGIPEVRFLVVSHPHNVFLDMWLQLGLPGLILGPAIVAWAAWTAWRLFRTAQGGLDRVWALALLAAWLELAAHGMVDEGYFTGDLALTFWLFVAAVAVLRREARAPAAAPLAEGAKQDGTLVGAGAS